MYGGGVEWYVLVYMYIYDICYTVASPDQMNDWNPMMEDYMDARNSYKVDVDDAGVATLGYSKYSSERTRFGNDNTLHQVFQRLGQKQA